MKAETALFVLLWLGAMVAFGYSVSLTLDGARQSASLYAGVAILLAVIGWRLGQWPRP